MCGIAGWFDNEIDMSKQIPVLYKMSQTLSKRGPDENGLYINKGCALLHRRLIVIDKENGKQPMAARHRGKTYIIVYNGELYNTDELREDLKASGYHFRGHSDTEVVLKSYMKYKEKCADMLNGIFAFAIYDVSENSIFLCRDKIGVKPLFYYEYDGGILFASEIKALLASKIVKPQIDETGLYEIFFLGPARTPSCGVFKGIKELKPGESALYKNQKLTKKVTLQFRRKNTRTALKKLLKKHAFCLPTL